MPAAAARWCADQVAHVAHLNARDTTLVFVSRAPQADIARLKARMGWEMPWFTITDSFDADFGVDEWHGTNVFYRDGDRVFRTYFINNRGDEQMGSTWNYLDITPLGRQEVVGGLARGLSADPALQVVELARQLRRGGGAGQEMGRGVGRRRGGDARPKRGREPVSLARSWRPAGATRLAAPGAVDWLALAAAPTFALMAIATGSSPAMALCAPGAGVPPVDGMTAIYLLMGLFHLPPWLRLARRWSGSRPTIEEDRP